MRNYRTNERYEQFDQKEDFSSYAEALVEQAEEMGIPIDSDPGRVKNLVKSDLRDVISSRIFELVGRIVSAVESASDEEV